MKPFRIDISQSILDDLKDRLAKTRWPDEIENSHWDYGTNKTYLKELCTYWEHDFDWRKQESMLNDFSHYKAEVDGSQIHFIHQPGKGSGRVPLLLINGWPDSFVRFTKTISMLTEVDESGLSFDLVIPSIPGYGFSDLPTKPGMDKKQIAHLFAELMTKQLGYKQFLVHGGDWGAGITEQLGLYHPDVLSGIHMTDIPFEHTMIEVDNPSKDEQKFFKEIKEWQMKEGAYNQIQSTGPQTLAYGLNDSPAGLAGWIVEKFYSWSDINGNLESVFSKDELLTNLTIYWATQTINSSMRIYYEAMKTFMNAMYNPLVKLNPFDKTGKRCKVPAGFALFPEDIGTPPKEFADRFFEIRQWTKMPKGGHFAAMEQPQLLVQDIRKFALLLTS